MAAPVFGTIGTRAAISGSTSSFTANVPASVASGDILIIFGQVEADSGNVAIPTLASTNFTAIAQNTYPHSGGGTDYTQFCLWKRATAGDTGTYTVTYTSNGSSYSGSCICMRVTGGKSSGTPTDVSDHQQGTNPTNFPNTSVTAQTDSLLVAFYGAFSTGTLTAPSGFTNRFAGGVGTDEFAVATKDGSAGGTQAATGAVWSASDGEMDAFLFTVISDTSAPAGGGTVALEWQSPQPQQNRIQGNLTRGGTVPYLDSTPTGVTSTRDWSTVSTDVIWT